MEGRHLFPFLLILLLSTYTFAADYEKGSVAAKNGDYATALNEWEPLAEQGDASGQNGLGWLYLTGNGVSRDYKIAFKLFTLSAEQGDAKAQNNLGQMYREGQGVTQDLKTALKWYKLAAEQGVATAQYLLGNMYDSGMGVTQDFTRAFMWWADLPVPLRPTGVHRSSIAATHMAWTTLADGMKSLVRGDIGPVFARSVLFNPSFPFHHSLPAPGG